GTAGLPDPTGTPSAQALDDNSTLKLNRLWHTIDFTPKGSPTKFSLNTGQPRRCRACVSQTNAIGQASSLITTQERETSASPAEVF
ncbi:unnamed protein product, partial [marine sediment metagenome]